MDKIVALIPARGGSKGVPRKNIKLLGKNPLIAYTIEASLAAYVIDRTIVSTEDEEIAQISQDYGAEIPFMRPAELSGDVVLDFSVIKHCLDYLIQINNKPEILVFLRPTMPLRTSQEIDTAVQMLLENKSADCIRTARPVPYPPYWMKKINSSGYLEPYDEHVVPFAMTRRHDLPTVVMCDGYVDAAKVKSVLKEDKFPPGNILAYYRENVPFIDIDTPEDWEYCEYFLSKRNK